ncbi:MAG: hypothetical protein RID09_14705 [Coleofasciculus sp. G1-WW12-02]
MHSLKKFSNQFCILFFVATFCRLSCVSIQPDLTGFDRTRSLDKVSVLGDNFL